MNKIERYVFIHTIFIFWCTKALIIGTDNFRFLNLLLQILLLVFFILVVSVQIFICIKYFYDIKFGIKLIAKMIFGLLFLIMYFWITIMVAYIVLYGFLDDGGIIRNIIGVNKYIFSWYEVLFWNFIFSLHYPIYIFIFIKPFVNHLDRSIKEYKSSMKDLNEKNETKNTQS